CTSTNLSSTLSSPHDDPHSPHIFYSSPLFFLMIHRPPISTLFPYTTLFRSRASSRRTTSRSSRLPPASSEPSAWRGRSRRPATRSEEHTSELQSHLNLVCRLLLEKKKINSYWKSFCRCSRSRHYVMPCCCLL